MYKIDEKIKHKLLKFVKCPLALFGKIGNFSWNLFQENKENV